MYVQLSLFIESKLLRKVFKHSYEYRMVVCRGETVPRLKKTELGEKKQKKESVIFSDGDHLMTEAEPGNSSKRLPCNLPL